MPEKKKAAGQEKRVSARAHKVQSEGLWIAPDLERKIKGEGGRRGLTDPPYGYYLHLADLVLKPPAPRRSSGEPQVSKEQKPEAPSPLLEPRLLQTIARPPAPMIPVRPAVPSESLVDEIPAPLPPIAPRTILPTLRLPKPPKRGQTPNAPKRVAPKSLSRPRPPKSAVPRSKERARRANSSIPKAPKPKR